MKRRYMRCAALLALGVVLVSKAEIAPLQQATLENKANAATTKVVSVQPELRDNLVPQFLRWIVDETQLLTPPPPHILLVYPNEMHERAGGSRSVLALYDWEAATIYLPTKWDVTRMYDRALLLHELVHHVQQFNQVGATCRAEHERQAYALTAKWLAEQGVVDPYGLLNTDELTVAMLSNCWGPMSRRDGGLHTQGLEASRSSFGQEPTFRKAYGSQITAFDLRPRL